MTHHTYCDVTPPPHEKMQWHRYDISCYNILTITHLVDLPWCSGLWWRTSTRMRIKCRFYWPNSHQSVFNGFEGTMAAWVSTSTPRWTLLVDSATGSLAALTRSFRRWRQVDKIMTGWFLSDEAESNWFPVKYTIIKPRFYPYITIYLTSTVRVMPLLCYHIDNFSCPCSLPAPRIFSSIPIL